MYNRFELGLQTETMDELFLVLFRRPIFVIVDTKHDRLENVFQIKRNW